jgi:hypothetical protein
MPRKTRVENDRSQRGATTVRGRSRDEGSQIQRTQDRLRETQYELLERMLAWEPNRRDLPGAAGRRRRGIFREVAVDEATGDPTKPPEIQPTHLSRMT